MPNPADAQLALIISQVESSQLPYSLRFEPRTFADIAALSAPVIKTLELISRCNNCDFQTAKVIYSTSWGLYQLMGFNIYESGYSGSIARFLNDTGAQLELFTAFLTEHSINETWAA